MRNAGTAAASPCAVLQREVAGIPAGVVPDAVGVLESGEEFVTQKRVAVTAERIPFPRIELIDALMNSALHHPPWTSSISRYRSASRAAMQPAPAEVMACL